MQYVFRMNEAVDSFSSIRLARNLRLLVICRSVDAFIQEFRVARSRFVHSQAQNFVVCVFDFAHQGKVAIKPMILLINLLGEAKITTDVWREVEGIISWLGTLKLSTCLRQSGPV